MKMTKRILGIVVLTILGLLLSSCTTTRVVEAKNDRLIEIRDTLVLRDSLVYIPQETVKDFALDSLILETDLAISKTWYDSTLGVLKGELKNKGALRYKETVKYRDRVVLDTAYVEIPKVIETTRYRTPLWSYALILALTALSLITIIYIFKNQIFKKY